MSDGAPPFARRFARAWAAAFDFALARAEGLLFFAALSPIAAFATLRALIVLRPPERLAATFPLCFSRALLGLQPIAQCRYGFAQLGNFVLRIQF